MTSEYAQEWIDRARLSIAQGALTNSKRAATFVEGVYPQHVLRGEGPYLWDVDEKKYVDFICGLGSNLFGYANPELALREIAPGFRCPSFSTPYEVVLAERLKAMFPFIDRLKFLKSGTEACNAAVRIARAWTGKELVLSEGYHGWGDDFTALDTPAAGVPKGVKAGIQMLGPSHAGTDFPNLTDKVAAVIVEPVMCDASPERRQWLERLRDKCKKVGALLIFDEVITGFRFPKFSVANYWGIRPDLICLGKAMGGGMAISAVGGGREVMDNPEYFVSSTFAGETLPIRVADKALRLLQENQEYSLTALWEAGQDWLDRFNRLWPEMLTIEAYPTRGAFKCISPEFKALFWQEACKAGILFGPSWFFNFALAKIDRAIQLQSLQEIMWKVKSGKAKLEGKLPVPPKSQMIRSQKPR